MGDVAGAMAAMAVVHMGPGGVVENRSKLLDTITNCVNFLVIF